jgi:cystathionine gamma-lyase
MLNNEELFERMKYLQNAVGAVPSPFDCYMVNRGLKTLPLRMQQHMQNGLKVASSLVSNPRIEKVIYPGTAFFFYTLFYQNFTCNKTN